MSSRRDFIRNAGAMFAAPFVAGGFPFRQQERRASSSPATAAQKAARGTLTVSSNNRYLADADNIPFLLQGDAAWSLIVTLGKAEASEYLQNRREKGFNTILVNLIEYKFSKNPPRNREGEAPFTTTGDFSTPNERYFAHADWILREASENGIYVLLAPIYLGYKGTDEGWMEELMALSLEKCLEYGRYLGRRYSDFDNIIWVMGGDRNPESALERVDLIAMGVKEHDSRHLFTAHCAPENDAAERYGEGGWLNFNTVYTYELVHPRLYEAYHRNPAEPFILIESSYEGEHNASEVQIRRQAYWSILCGGFGHVFGNNPIWHFDGPGLFPVKETWRQAMDLPGSVGMKHWGNLFRSRKWHELIPDEKHEVVVKGLGEFRGLDYLAAANTADGSTVIVYMPTSRAITVDMSKLSGSKATAWWFDPRSGGASDAGAFATQGLHAFSPPGPGDWVLVVDDASKQLPKPGVGFV
ncbi:MAG TPA: glycoside hydrolase family 140 protein [Terriglobia bacterium]|nr:glycoside hydrolase family 140 protein [Terriglobia bacterium]